MSSAHFFADLRKHASASMKAGLANKPLHQDVLVDAGLLSLDLSRQPLTQDLLTLCIKEAEVNGLPQHIQNLFAGEKVNPTEDRAALHWLLRALPGSAPAQLAQQQDAISITTQAMDTFARQVIDGQYHAHPGTPIQTVVNLGVGGSDLGPRLAYDALKQHHNHLNVEFVANIDGLDLTDTLHQLDPHSTLFIVTSKTFSTLETLENTKAATAWLQAAGISNPGAHFAAATSRPDRAAEFGINESRIFPMWDWVGGRYSLLSSVGLALLLGIGPEAFARIKAGAQHMDQHFQTAPLSSNAPFVQAMAGLVAVNGLDIKNHAVIAYDSRLNLLPNYLQQLEMESNGKSVKLDSTAIDYATCPVIWGGVGTNTQHSFHQLLHQGPLATNIDFLMPMGQTHGLPDHQAYLQANCLAQAEALLHGKSMTQVQTELRAEGLRAEEIAILAPHKVIQGNKPCTIIGYETLSAQVLGALIALYEHKVFVQAHFWQINPFDQWGVELGKQLCQPAYEAISQSAVSAKDPRTQRWIDRLKPELAK